MIPADSLPVQRRISRYIDHPDSARPAMISRL